MSKGICLGATSIVLGVVALGFGCSSHPSGFIDKPDGSGGTAGASGGTTGTASGGIVVIVDGGAGGDAGSSASAGCAGDCKTVVPFCGDGIINQDNEVCDDGNSVGADGCTAACDQIEDGWTCPTPGQLCVNTTECGDGRVAGGETCDDGNTAAGDGCSRDCQVEPGYVCPVLGSACRTLCGDKLTLGSEQCDDGNTSDGDGCDSRCQLEPGYVCDETGSCRETVCGDGIKEGTEQCDDTGPGQEDLPFDGCYHCLLEPDCSAGSCKSPCGDGQRFSDEECDDGNLFDGDGCSSSCKIETGFACTDSATGALAATKDVPVVVRDFIGLGHEATPDPDVGHYHPDFNSHYGADTPLFSMVKTTLGQNGKPVWRWWPYATADITTDATPDRSLVPAPLANCQCDESAALTSWDSSQETWSGSWAGGPITFALARPPCSCTDGSACVCDNPGHLFKDGCMADTNRRNLSTPADLEQWYTNVEGVNLTLPYTLTLALTDAATGTYSNIDTAGATAFDPIAGEGWVALGNETPTNCGTSGATNASFTTETHFWFEYQGGEQFAFSGDDDTWVFINNQLVVDLGGLHGKEDGSFTLDTADGSAVSINRGQYYDGTTYSYTQGANVSLGLELGQVYEVSMFQAERNECGSNFGVTLKNFSKPKSSCDSVCGDGVVAADEYCDDGTNTSTYNGCGPNCIPAPYCGDGVVQPEFEACDDGLNISQYDGCGPGCQRAPYCGDGRVQAPWEDCDDGVNAGGYAKCGPNCHYDGRCGDGILQPDYEECDDGADNGTTDCLQNCTIEKIIQ